MYLYDRQSITVTSNNSSILFNFWDIKSKIKKKKPRSSVKTEFTFNFYNINHFRWIQ